MGTAIKKSISFDPALLREAEAAARQDCGGNLSAFVAGAVAHRVKVREGAALLLRDQAELGPVPQDVARDVDSQWSR